MDASSPGRHGKARLTFAPFAVDLEREERRQAVEDAAFVLFGAKPLKSHYQHGLWHVTYIPDSVNQDWFTETFGECDVAVFVARRATGVDTHLFIGFERVK